MPDSRSDRERTGGRGRVGDTGCAVGGALAGVLPHRAPGPRGWIPGCAEARPAAGCEVVVRQLARRIEEATSGRGTEEERQANASPAARLRAHGGALQTLLANHPVEESDQGTVQVVVASWRRPWPGDEEVVDRRGSDVSSRGDAVLHKEAIE